MHRPAPRTPKSKQHGQMGIIGPILGILIIALIVVLAVRYFNGGKASQQTQAAVADFTTIATRIQHVYRQDPKGYTGATAATLIDGHLVPDTYIQGTSIVSPYSTGIEVAVDDSLSGTGNGLTFTYQVPAHECVDFATGVAGSAIKVNVGGGIVQDLSATDSPFNATALQTGCATSANGSVPVALTIGR